MGMLATPLEFFTNPASTATWTALGAATVRFNDITFFPYKSSGTANTGDVYVRPKDGNGYIILNAAGGSGKETFLSWPAAPGSFFRANQFEIQIQTAGDGIYVLSTQAVIYDGP